MELIFSLPGFSFSGFGYMKVNWMSPFIHFFLSEAKNVASSRTERKKKKEEIKLDSDFPCHVFSEPRSAECFFCNIHLFIYLLLNIKFTSFFCTTRRSKETKEHGNVIFLCQFSSSVNQGKISVYYLYIHVFQKFKCFSFSQHGTKNKTKEIEVTRKMKYKKIFTYSSLVYLLRVIEGQMSIRL